MTPELEQKLRIVKEAFAKQTEVFFGSDDASDIDVYGEVEWRQHAARTKSGEGSVLTFDIEDSLWLPAINGDQSPEAEAATRSFLDKLCARLGLIWDLGAEDNGQYAAIHFWPRQG